MNVIKKLLGEMSPEKQSGGQQPLRRVPKYQKQTNKRRLFIIGGSVAVGILILILLCVLLTRGDALKGTWDMDGTTVYQFEGNGNGAMLLPSKTYEFKYTIDKENNTVSIDFEDERASDYTYNYEVSRDKLILSGSEGKESFEYVFTRKED